MSLEPVQKSRLYQQVMQQIKEQIKKGRFKPGSRLPSERELAEILQVGRSTVREAVTVLESLGLLEVRPGAGTYVRDFQNRGSVEAFFDIFVFIWEIEPSEIIQLLQVREILEPQVAVLAAENANAADLHELGRVLEEMKEATARGEVGDEYDYSFHYLIARSTGNKIILSTLNALSDLMRRGLQQTRWIALADPGRARQIINEHEMIVRALAEKDGPAARKNMLQHLQGVALNFSRYLKEE